MHALSRLQSPVPTLYVRSLSSYGGPEYAISSIFHKARQFAPCYLVFEDLDSIVTDSVRSYFLNEVDGLESNDGILMIGSTNHLERLDPGISKRPSRFDRKYFFPDPDEEQRVQYCKFWRNKLQDNEDVDFPEVLDKPIARITKGFSFAYMQEAFVASLLAIAAQGDEEEDSLEENPGDDDASKPALGLAQPYDRAYGQQPSEGQRHSYKADPFAGYLEPPKSCMNKDIPPSGCVSYQFTNCGTYNPATTPIRCAVPPNPGNAEGTNESTATANAHGFGRPQPGNMRREEENGDQQKEKELDKYILWRQMKKQIKILRRELEEEK